MAVRQPTRPQSTPTARAKVEVEPVETAGQHPTSAISGAIGIGLIGAAIQGPIGALVGMVFGGLIGHLTHRRAESEPN
jgi:predicted lipid-binding transport protein (Tim44 family)